MKYLGLIFYLIIFYLSYSTVKVFAHCGGQESKCDREQAEICNRRYYRCINDASTDNDKCACLTENLECLYSTKCDDYRSYLLKCKDNKCKNCDPCKIKRTKVISMIIFVIVCIIIFIITVIAKIKMDKIKEMERNDGYGEL